jgi:hypothetical protein
MLTKLTLRMADNLLYRQQSSWASSTDPGANGNGLLCLVIDVRSFLPLVENRRRFVIDLNSFRKAAGRESAFFGHFRPITPRNYFSECL